MKPPLGLEPQEAAPHFHFGREPFIMGRRKFFELENAEDVSKHHPLDARPSTDRAEREQVPREVCQLKGWSSRF